jgi:hypothetical protein
LTYIEKYNFTAMFVEYPKNGEKVIFELDNDLFIAENFIGINMNKTFCYTSSFRRNSKKGILYFVNTLSINLEYVNILEFNQHIRNGRFLINRLSVTSGSTTSNKNNILIITPNKIFENYDLRFSGDKNNSINQLSRWISKSDLKKSLFENSINFFNIKNNF